MKDKLIEIALQQFLKHGIRKMTVQKLIELMGISGKTFHRYFGDKEELLKYCLLKHYAGLVKKFEEINNESKCPVVSTFKIWYRLIETDFGTNYKFYYDLNNYYPLLQDLVLHQLDKNNRIFLQKLIYEGIEGGYFRNDIIPELVFEVSSMLYASITRNHQFKNYKLRPAALIHNTVDVYLRGICTEKGLKELQKSYSIIIKSTQN